MKASLLFNNISILRKDLGTFKNSFARSAMYGYVQPLKISYAFSFVPGRVPGSKAKIFFAKVATVRHGGNRKTVLESNG